MDNIYISANGETSACNDGGNPVPRLDYKLYKEGCFNIEEWKDILGLEGYYQISNSGKVRSLDRYVKANKHGGIKMLKGREMRLSVGNSGYYVVNLRKEMSNKVWQVHRLVAEHFLNKSEVSDTVNHIDGNKLNNNVSNLEWATYRENNTHAIRMNLRKPKGSKVAQIDDKGNIINKFISVTEASRQTGISRGMISHNLNGRSDSAGNYKWEYIK